MRQHTLSKSSAFFIFVLFLCGHSRNIISLSNPASNFNRKKEHWICLERKNGHNFCISVCKRIEHEISINQKKPKSPTKANQEKTSSIESVIEYSNCRGIDGKNKWKNPSTEKIKIGRSDAEILDFWLHYSTIFSFLKNYASYVKGY